MHDQSETLFKAKQDLDEAQQKLADDESTYRPARTPLDAELQALRTAILTSDPELAKAMVGSPAEQISQLDTAKGRLLQTHPDLQETINRIADLDKTYEPVYTERRSHGEEGRGQGAQ